MRITAGKFRGRVLKAPKGDATRPTASRLREALFNLLRERVEGASLLDLFAGSGAIGFEALSRGALSVHFVEVDRKAALTIRENSELLEVVDEVTLTCRDVFKTLKSFKDAQFSLIFADPPYGKGFGRLVAEEVAALSLLKEGGLLLIEEGSFIGKVEGLHLVDERNYGSAFLSIFSPSAIQSQE